MKVKKASFIKEQVIPIVSNSFLALLNLYCLLIYYNEVTDKNLLDLGYVAYMALFLNGLMGLTKFVNDESFIDLRILLDYAQTVLPHPFLTTALWQKLGVGPNETALMHCFLGLGAFLFFVLMEYKRQDLTDLALIISIPSSIIVGILYQNYFAAGAGFLLAIAYFSIKRSEECAVQTSNTKAGYYNVCMAVYSVITLAQFGPKNWVPQLMGSE